MAAERERLRRMLCALLVSVPLAALVIAEGIQVHVPGRTPELTDPLLALILGFSLMLLERYAKRPRLPPRHV